jgi:hypothetical protein
VIIPNKAVPIRDSALGHAAAIMQRGPASIDLMRLYKEVADEFESIDQFLLTLDLLYVIGRIDIDLQTRAVTYVG